MGHFAGLFELGDEIVHLAADIMAVSRLGYVTEVYDRVLSCVTEETSGVQFCNTVTIWDSFKIRFGFFVDRGQSFNLVLHLIFLCSFSLGIFYVLASVTILRFGGVFVTVFALGVCS